MNRDKAFAKGDKQKFTSLRNKVRDEIKKEKQRFYRVKVKPLQSNNPKDWWKSIKRICGIGKNQKINLVNPDSGEPLTSEESVECINDYLINLTKDYNKISNDLQLGGDDLDLPTISRECVAQKLKEININKSPGPFDPPTIIIKHFAEQLSGPLTDIINTSFQEKCFGEIWKAYNCCPIPKSNPCTTVGDIRPIALTSVFSKIQVRIICTGLDVGRFKGLSQRTSIWGNSSFVVCISPPRNATHMVCRLGETQIGNYRIVFLDFSKAFDLIDHNILLNDFKSVGVRPALLPWLASYLSDRLQRVNIDGSTSRFKKINAGVPQGSENRPDSIYYQN